MKLPSSLTLPATSLIPSISMGLGTLFLDLDDEKQNILKGLTVGMLVTGSVLLLPDAFKTVKGRNMALFGFLTSLVVINFSSIIGKHTKNSALTSLYFDSVSDGLLLGTLLHRKADFNKVKPLLVPMSIEMALTGSNVAKVLQEENVTNGKIKAALAAVILAIAIIVGKKAGKLLNNEFIMGLGSASMLWLGLSEFMPSLMKNPSMLNNLAIYGGVVATFFMEQC